MTCIVGIVKGENVYIGADSAGVSGSDYIIRKDKKVFQNGIFLMGCTTSFRMIDLLKYKFDPPRIYKNKDLHEQMCTNFVDKVRECFKTGGFAQEKDKAEKAGTFLVGVNGRLFTIESDYQVGESLCGYDAIGSGMCYAKGSLHTTHKLNTEPIKRIEMALNAAADNCTSVYPPMWCMHLKQKKYSELGINGLD